MVKCTERKIQGSYHANGLVVERPIRPESDIVGSVGLNLLVENVIVFVIIHLLDYFGLLETT